MKDLTLAFATVLVGLFLSASTSMALNIEASVYVDGKEMQFKDIVAQTKLVVSGINYVKNPFDEKVVTIRIMPSWSWIDESMSQYFLFSEYNHKVAVSDDGCFRRAYRLASIQLLTSFPTDYGAVNFEIFVFNSDWLLNAVEKVFTELRLNKKYVGIEIRGLLLLRDTPQRGIKGLEDTVYKFILRPLDIKVIDIER